MSSPTDTSHRPSLDYLVKKGSVITLITLISRPLGFVREAVQAYLFGATFLVDAFVLAFNFPEMIQNLLFTGATSAFLIPVCSKYMHDKEDFSRIYSTFLNLSIVLMGIVSIIFFFLSSDVMKMTGFRPETHQVATYLFMIMIPVILLHAMLSIMKAFLNAKEHFAAPEFSGIIWNIIFIFMALLFAKKIGIYSLAIGVSLGSLAQVIVQIPYLRKNDIKYHLSMDLRHPALREAGHLFAGALIATSIVPINNFVGRVIASHLPSSGEVASLAYAFRIFILPFSLFAVPVYTVLFSKISGLYHQKDLQGMRSHIDGSLVLLSITLIPCTIFLCLMGDVIIRIIYQRGAFTAGDTAMTYKALFGYGLGLIFYALSICFVRIFNAFHDVKTPAIVGISSIILNALLGYLLMGTLKNFGIALATSVVSFYNFLILYLLFKKKIDYRISSHTRQEIVRSVLAGVIVTILILAIRWFVGPRIYLAFALSLLGGGGVYAVFFKDYYLRFLRRRQKA